MSKTSIPLKNLRGTLLLLIVAFHAFSAYIVSQPASTPAFDQPPYDWRIFPIVDNQRWLGFDLFCAFQFLYLMQFMFFLSGLFVWSSLQRKSWREFLVHRFARLGVPFVIGVYALMPLTFYPVYRVTAIDPSWSAFWAHWAALPTNPTGPMWFLWCLLVLDVCAVVIYWLAPRTQRHVAPLLAGAMARPGMLFAVLLCLTALAYLPLSAIYSPWYWIDVGPFEIQATFGPQYAIYFFFGLVVGAHGFDRGVFAVDGPLARHWLLWAIGTVAAFCLWIISAALIAKVPDAPVDALRIVGDLGLVIFTGAICFSMRAIFQRFARRPLPVVNEVSEHGYGAYFFHYTIALWLQYALLDRALPAIAKGILVFAVTVAASLAVSALTDRIVASSGVLLARRAPWLVGHFRGAR